MAERLNNKNALLLNKIMIEALTGDFREMCHRYCVNITLNAVFKAKWNAVARKGENVVI